jgi:hypothetical protein
MILIRSKLLVQKTTALSATKLVDLIQGRYDEFKGHRWGMGEFDDFEEKYLLNLSDDEKLLVFHDAYKALPIGDIEQLLDLASSFKVKFSSVYTDILRTETDKDKLKVFFIEVHYYINECWSDSAKELLVDEDKQMMNKLCTKYGLPLLF